MNQKDFHRALLKVSASPIQGTVIRYSEDVDKFIPGMRGPLDKYELIDDREVAINEITWELDYTNFKKCATVAREIVSALETRGIQPMVCLSGGKGIHVSAWFDKIELRSDKHKELFRKAVSLGYSAKLIRVWFWNLILDEVGVPTEERGSGKPLDSNCVAFGDASPHLIKNVGGRRKIQKDGEWKVYYKTWVPSNEIPSAKTQVQRYDDVRFPPSLTMFRIDEHELMSEVKNYAAKQEAAKVEPDTNVEEILYTQLESVQTMLEGMPLGRRMAGAQLIAVAFRIDKKPIEAANAALEKYADACDQGGHPFTAREAQQWAQWVYNQPDVFWNCSQVRALEVHNDEECLHCMKKKGASLRLLKDKTLLDAVTDYLDVEIVGERDVKVLMFLLMLSKGFPSASGNPGWNVPGDPSTQNIILSSDSGSGKSYIVKRLLELFGEPDKDFFIVSRISKSALNYYTEINMDGKIIFIEEMQGLDENTSQLRVWMSEGKLTLHSVEKVRNAEGVEANKLVINSTRGRPVFITNQAEGEIGEQLNNRSWVIGLDVSEPQTKEILRFQDSEAQGRVTRKVVEGRIITDAIRLLKPYHYVIPFADYECMGIPTRDVRARRDYQKFLTLIRCSAHLHQKQREVTADDTGAQYITCTIEDYDVARRYCQGILGATFSGLTLTQIDAINFLKKSSFHQMFSIGDLQRVLGKNHSYWKNTLHQLEELGFVSSQQQGAQSATYSLNVGKSMQVVSLPTGEELVARLKLKGVELGGVLSFSRDLPNIQCQKDEGNSGIVESGPGEKDSTPLSNTRDLPSTNHKTLNAGRGVMTVRGESEYINENFSRDGSETTLLVSHPEWEKPVDTRVSIYDAIRSALRSAPMHLLSVEDVLNYTTEYKQEEAGRAIAELMNKGDVYEPRPGFIRLT